MQKETYQNLITSSNALFDPLKKPSTATMDDDSLIKTYLRGV